MWHHHDVEYLSTVLAKFVQYRIMNFINDIATKNAFILNISVVLIQSNGFLKYCKSRFCTSVTISSLNS